MGVYGESSHSKRGTCRPERRAKAVSRLLKVYHSFQNPVDKIILLGKYQTNLKLDPISGREPESVLIRLGKR